MADPIFEPRPCIFQKLNIFWRWTNDISVTFWFTYWFMIYKKWPSPGSPGTLRSSWIDKPGTGQIPRLQLLLLWLVQNRPPFLAWISMTLVWIPWPQVLLQLDHADIYNQPEKRKIFIDIHNKMFKAILHMDFVNDKPGPGQFPRLQLWLLWLLHNWPPFSAWTSMTLVWIPNPQVLLQMDHVDILQSTERKV